MDIKLRLPVLPDEEKVWDFKEEFANNQEGMNGTSDLDNIDNFEEWFDKVQKAMNSETVPVGRVLSTVFLAVDELDSLVGIIQIRHSLNEYLKIQGGHIGYCVRKSERQKGYATEMLRLALLECERLGIEDVLLVVDKENIPSQKTILKQAGQLENEITDDESNRILQRYWIKNQVMR